MNQQVMKAIFLRDARTALRGKTNLLIRFGCLILNTALLYFLATSTEPDRFPFLLTGFILTLLMGTSLGSFSRTLCQSRKTGALEAIFSTPVHSPLYLTGSLLWPFLQATVELFLYLIVAALAFGMLLPNINLIPALVSLFLTLTSLMGVAILASPLFLLLKKGYALVWLITVASAILGGAFFSVSFLPAWTQTLAEWTPLYHALAAFRSTLLSHGGFTDIGIHLWSLLGFTAFFWPVGFLGFALGIQRVSK